MTNISKSKARKIYLNCQGLNGSLASSLSAIQTLSYVQLDTISVVERAHHHTLWARNPEYKSSDLDALFKKKKVFEYWDHAAAVLPMENYRYSLVRKRAFVDRDTSWLPKNEKLTTFGLKCIEENGPMKSADFKHKRPKRHSGWWDWNPMKKALERLFHEGKLMVSRRDGFQKVYDLTENVLPKNINTSVPNLEEYAEYLIQKTIGHHGLASANSCAYLRNKEIKVAVQKKISQLVKDKKLVEIEISGVSRPYYSTEKIIETQSNRLLPRVKILSPFDNAVIQREKLGELFNFNYRIECYVPAAKRVYGYFALPVLYGDKFVARIDCKVNRKTRSLHVHQKYFEQHVTNTQKQMIEKKLDKELKNFADFNKCGRIIS